jgi:hypothetical protein
MAASAAQATTLDFTTDMALGGDAYINESHVLNGVILTNRDKLQNGNAFTTESFENIGTFTAEFDMKLGSGTGASGLTFAWVTDPSASTSAGSNLGFTGMTGYAVEFDTYNSGNWDSGSDNHVAVIQNSTTSVLIQEEVNFNLNNAVYHHVDIEFDNGIISVDIDGQNYIDDFEIQGYSGLDGYFGFTAATGPNYADWHKVKNFTLTNVSPVPEPSTYALMLGGLGLVGFMAYRRRKTA